MIDARLARRIVARIGYRMALERRLFGRAWRGLHLHERFIGLLLFGVGFAILWTMYAFWSSGFASAVNPPLPSGMKPNMAFAFNPVVCMFPFISIGAIGLMILGIRRALWPE